ncbi:MAG TPA: MFS transporter [Ktedonobacteraceae bacterium]|nr:MFS transporter [Ktedonobacteraceae bacterium]
MTAKLSVSRSLSRLLINRSYAFLWGGQAVSSLGDSIYNLTLIVWIAAEIARQADGQPTTWAPIAVSGVLVAVALPSLLFGSIAGVFVDRWDKKRTMLWMDFLRMLLVALLILVSGSSFFPWKPTVTVQLSAIYATVFLTSVCSQFFTPARATLIRDLVDKKQLGRASGLAQVSQSIALIMGPPLAAPVLFSVGVQWALLFNALTFLVSFLCIQAIRVERTAKNGDKAGQANFGREFLEGMTFFFKNRVLQVLFVTVIVASLGAGAINSLMIFFVTQNLHVAVTYVGLLDGFFGVGVIVGAILVSAISSKLEITWLFVVSILGFGILFLLLARTTNVFVAFSILLLLGLAQVTINITIVPMVLGIVPREMVGRVMGTLNPVGVLATLISVSLAGYLSSDLFANIHGSLLGFVFGPIDTIFTLSALLFLISGFYALVRLRPSFSSSSVEQEATS